MILRLIKSLLAGPAAPTAIPAHAPAAAPAVLDMDGLSRLVAEGGHRLMLVWRGDDLLALLAATAAPQAALLAGRPAQDLDWRLGEQQFSRLLLRRLEADGRASPLEERPDLLDALAGIPGGVGALTGGDAAPQADGGDFRAVFRDYLRALRSDPALIDFLYAGYAARRAAAAPDQHLWWPPFDNPAVLPPTVPAEPRRRSALLLHNSYYHYNNLAEGLKRRGWEVMTVSLASPDSPAQQFYHGEDLNLWDDDYDAMREKARDFFATVPGRFGALHFYGKGMPSFFYDNCEQTGRETPLPWDFMELRRHRTVIGYMASGCLDGARQSSIRDISGGVCGRCVWEHRPDVCNDDANAFWAERLEAVCDWIGLENDWATPERTGRQYVRGPIITALDPDRWRPDLEVPEDMRIDRAPGEILVYHAVGNYASRRVGDRDIKGTGAVMDAIDRLKAEGVPVRLFFATNVPSKTVRFLQVQADIVIDQLNYGRLGANAREALMLGRPLISSLDAHQAAPLPRLAYIDEAPVVAATEASIYDVLKDVSSHPDRWPALGAASRAFALKWHAADACAARFERVIDRVAAGEAPEQDD